MHFMRVEAMLSQLGFLSIFLSGIYVNYPFTQILDATLSAGNLSPHAKFA